MPLQIQGKIIAIYQTTQHTESFKSRDFVIETDGQYPQPVKFQLTQDRVDLIDAYRIGDVIDVHFNIRGNKIPDGRYFNNLEAWKMVRVGASQPASTPEPAQPHDPQGLPF